MCYYNVHYNLIIRFLKIVKSIELYLKTMKSIKRDTISHNY